MNNFKLPALLRLRAGVAIVHVPYRSERPARIAALEREIEHLSHVEEALIEAAIARGETVNQLPSPLPQAALA